MGTSLTPDFWRLFGLLLGISVTVAFVVSAVVDTLVVRLQERRRRRRPVADRTDIALQRPDRPRQHLVHH